ncbi:P-loop containing nucleoside triphosphate hydrolase protein [Lactifluus subvellereus]|nr:P-loop containing nucleoside triphosphate hydrolase protein [Lactifluus subvellereus]
MSSSAVQRRSSRTSVLGKRTHQSQFDTAPSPASIKSVSADPLDDNDDASPVDLGPCAKRPRTSFTPTDRNGNKENIPPLRVDLLIGSPRALRRSSTEFVTPTHSRMTLRRHVSTSNLVTPDTPTMSIAHLGLQTPPLTPSIPLPLHIRTRALLRATCNGSADIAGRIPERQFIRDFITEFIGSRPTAQAIKPVLYISGSPGCGKTALVNSILATFEVALLENNVKIVVINCMALNGLEAVWERLIEELGSPDKRRGKARSCEIVGTMLSNRTSKCIVILDEIDHVAASSQTLASLFALARNHSPTLRIIGIANTHTLTSSASALSVDGVTGVSTLHFAPYDPEQLLSILQSRLKPLTSLESPTSEAVVQRFLPAPTLSLLSRKIAAQTGDVRSLFEVLRGAIDLAVTQPPASEKDTPPVTPSHILTALKAYAPASKVTPAASSTLPSKSSTNSETVAKVRNLGLHARLSLLALLLASRRAGASLPLLSATQASPPRSPVKRSSSSPTPIPAIQASIEMTQLHAFYGAILTRGESDTFTPVSRSEFGDLAGVLETVGLVSLSASSPGRKLSRTTSFSSRGTKSLANTQPNRGITLAEGVRPDEVLRGLGIGAETKDICEEEVEGIWKRELSRIRKEARIQQPSANSINLGFDDATED